MNLPQPSDPLYHPSSRPTISQASVSDAISRLQREKARVQKESDQRKADFLELRQRFDKLSSHRDQLAAESETQQQLIKSLRRELGEDEAELDEEDEYPLLRRVRRECAKRMKDCEDRLKQLQSDRQRQASLLEKARKDLADAKDEADDAQRGAITKFNEQKRYESHIQRLQSEVYRANSAVEKMRTESVGLRVKIQDVRDERANLQRMHDNAEADNQRAVEERDSTILDLQSLLERRNQELDGLEQSVATAQDERTRLQLHSNETTMSLVALRQELEDSRAVVTTLRVSEEAGRQQLARMMDEQLAQNQTIEALRRQVETSNNAARDVQALLRANQDQQQQFLRMPPPSNLPALTGGIIGSTPFAHPFSTPSTGMRTRELHGPEYYHVGSPADPGYAEQMNAMYGRDEVDPPRRDPISSGSSSQGTSSHFQVKVSQHFQAVGSFQLEELILERLLTDAYNSRRQ
jgi:phage shock protein A